MNPPSPNPPSLQAATVERALTAAATALHLYYEECAAHAGTEADAERFANQCDAVQLLLRRPSAVALLTAALNDEPIAGLCWGITAHRTAASIAGAASGPLRNGDQVETYPTYSMARARADALNAQAASPNVYYIVGAPLRGRATMKGSPGSGEAPA